MVTIFIKQKVLFQTKSNFFHTLFNMIHKFIYALIYETGVFEIDLNVKIKGPWVRGSVNIESH